MFARRLGVVGAIAASGVLLCAQGAYATGGGLNTGAEGFVYNNVTVGGVTFTGSCQYDNGASGLTISGQATAAGQVTATTITCTVKHFVGSDDVARATLPGPFAAVEAERLVNPGSAICIDMSAVKLDASFADTGQYCVF